jgi:hypothetical protein
MCVSRKNVLLYGLRSLQLSWLDQEPKKFYNILWNQSLNEIVPQNFLWYS